MRGSAFHRSRCGIKAGGRVKSYVVYCGKIFVAGVALYTAEAAMMLDFLTLVINKKLTALELRQMIFAFPTQTYSVVSGLVPLLKQMRWIEMLAWGRFREGWLHNRKHRHKEHQNKEHQNKEHQHKERLYVIDNVLAFL